MPRVKEPPITPAVAAKQLDWHIAAAADYFAESCRTSNRPGNREAARRRFIENTKPGLAGLELDAYLATFKTALRDYWNRDGLYAEAEPVIREIAAEPQPMPAPTSAPATEPADKIALATRLLDAAIVLLSEPKKKRGAK